MTEPQVIVRPFEHRVTVREASGNVTVRVTRTAIRFVQIGRQGPPGPTGAQGPPGPAGGASYVHNQGAPSTTWTVIHNLGRKPSITVVDSGDNVVYGNYRYVDDNTVILEFSVPFGGKAYLN